MIIAVSEAKLYLRVDSDEDNALIENMIQTAEGLVMDVTNMTEDELKETSSTVSIAVLFATAYLYEHREEADHNRLKTTLRSLLQGVRKESF